MTANSTPKRMTVEEFIRYAATTDEDLEYIDGYAIPVFAADTTARHDLIVSNVSGELRSIVKQKSCRVYAGTRLYAPGWKPFRPDVTVACGPKFLDETLPAGLINPLVIVEVSSPPTVGVDHTDKWQVYQHIESLTDYLMVSQHRRAVEHFFRFDSGAGWRYEGVEEGHVALAGLDASLMLDKIYVGAFGE